MSEKYTNIDETWFPKKLREYADKLDEDFYDNILDVLKNLGFQTKTVMSKIQKLEVEMIQANLKVYMANRKKVKEKDNE